MRRISLILILVVSGIVMYSNCLAQDNTGLWMRFEKEFTSSRIYDNPLYDLKEFYAVFTSPSGQTKRINGFWDGGAIFKIRFMPDEIGEWTYETTCSDENNSGLHKKSGFFKCTENDRNQAIYQHGPIIHPAGSYHLTYNDGTPFFWVACTAWNGALKSTEEEWDTYLQHRKDHNYNIVQFVTTQWRGGDANALGEVAFEGSGRIKVNTSFFQHMDEKVDRINEYGLIAAPVLLWALPFGEGRELSPGYYLPDNESVLLAKYMVARYGANQVIWILGGDGKYTDELEDRWKYIGEQVFGGDHPGIATTHPMGRSWIGDIYKDVEWIKIIGYQSSHSNQKGTVEWITKGPIASQWDKLPPRPLINMEPNYEEIRFRIDAEDVRNASYWSIFAAPPAGITYGHNGIWPWIREGESILNHYHEPGTSTWREAIDFPGSLQIGYLAEFIDQFEWWKLKPAQDLLVEQPGDETFNHFISAVADNEQGVILAYVPHKSQVKLYNSMQLDYSGQWFDPVNNKYQNADIQMEDNIIKATPPSDSDYVLILRKK